MWGIQRGGLRKIGGFGVPFSDFEKEKWRRLIPVVERMEGGSFGFRWWMESVDFQKMGLDKNCAKQVCLFFWLCWWVESVDFQKLMAGDLDWNKIQRLKLQLLELLLKLRSSWHNFFVARFFLCKKLAPAPQNSCERRFGIWIKNGIGCGQIIATSHDRFPPNGGDCKGIPRKFQGNLGRGEILFHLARLDVVATCHSICNGPH